MILIRICQQVLIWGVLFSNYAFDKGFSLRFGNQLPLMSAENRNYFLFSCDRDLYSVCQSAYNSLFSGSFLIICYVCAVLEPGHRADPALRPCASKVLTGHNAPQTAPSPSQSSPTPTPTPSAGSFKQCLLERTRLVQYPSR